jgi:polyisoprenoid-binding protein YceI
MPATIAKTTWKIDAAHSSAEFKVRHMMISYVKGEFSGVSGVLELDDENYSRSTIEASIPVATLRTGNDDRDVHLRPQTSSTLKSSP